MLSTGLHFASESTVSYGMNMGTSLRQLRFPPRLKRGSSSSVRFFVSSSQNCAPQLSISRLDWRILDHR